MKWFSRKDENIVDLFRQEFPNEYSWARKTHQNINRRYVRNFFKVQNVFQ